MDPSLIFPKDTNYSRSFYPGQKGALSPEELACLQSKQTVPKVDVEACESWTIGMIILCTCLLVLEEKFYNWNSFEVNQHVLEEGLNKLSIKYSPQLSKLVQNCLADSSISRTKISQMHAEVQKRKLDNNYSKSSG